MRTDAGGRRSGDCRTPSRNRASAASRSRRSTSAQGLRLSLRLIAQKSWPSGAPARAAAASIAVMPGSTRMSSACQRRYISPAPRTRPTPSRTRRDRRDETITDVPACRGQFKRLVGALQLDAVVAGVQRQAFARRHARDIGNIADDVGRGQPAPRSTSGVTSAESPGPRPATTSEPVIPPAPAGGPGRGTRMIAK